MRAFQNIFPMIIKKDFLTLSNYQLLIKQLRLHLKNCSNQQRHIINLGLTQVKTTTKSTETLQILHKMTTSPTQSSTAIPFIYLENQKFIVSQQAENFLKQIKNPVAVLTIVGKYRTGKSLFLNRIMLNRSKAFKVSPTINSCTKGLWLWKDSLKVDNQEQQKDILIIDTEGFGATQQTDTYNNKILLFALLLSSFFVYNSVGSIDENSLNNISVIANLANDIQSKNAKDENVEQNFPSFLWLLRDFTLNLVDKNDIPIQAKEYLEQALEIQKGTSNQIQGKNRIRRMMKHFFQDRDCYTLVRPVETENKLQQLDTLNEEQFRSSFLDQAKSLKQRILRKIKPKKLKNTQLTGQSLFELAKNYVQVVNNNSLPNYQNSYRHLLKLEMTKMKKRITKQYDLNIKSFVNDNFKSLKSMEQFEGLKGNFLHLGQIDIRQKVKIHPSLSMVSFQEITAMLVQIKTVMTGTFDKYVKQSRQDMQQKYVSLINSIKEYNLMSNFLQNVMTEKDFKQFLNKIQAKIDSQAKTYQIPDFLLQNFNSQHFLPYRLSLQQQFNECSSRRFNQMNQQLKIKLQFKQELLRQRDIAFKRLENELSRVKDENSEYKLKTVMLQKQLTVRKDQMKKGEQTNKNTTSQLQQKVRVLQQACSKYQKQSQIRNHQMALQSNVIQQKNYQFNTIDKQLTINQQHLNFKITQISQKNLQMAHLQRNLTEKQSKIQTLASKIQQLREQKEEIYEKYTRFYEQMSARILDLQKTNSRHSSELKEYKRSLQKSETKFVQNQLYFKQVLEKEHKNIESLNQAISNFQLTLSHNEQKIQKFHKKQEKYKQFKRCIKNSSSIQCLHCTRFFMSSIFLTHLSLCTSFIHNQSCLQQVKSQNNQKEIVFKVLNINVDQNNGKPFTIYELQCDNGCKTWTIEKKFTQFCDFNMNLQNSLPGVKFSDAQSIFDTKYLSKKSLTVEEKKFLIEKYFNDLGKNETVKKNQYWLELIGITEKSDEKSQKKRTFLGQLKQNSSTNSRQTSILNYQMKKSHCKEDYHKSIQNNNHNSQSLRRQSMQTPGQFFKIWEQKQLRTKASSSCLIRGN